MTNTKILLELSSDEALVLFEWLSRFNQAKDPKFADQAEERALWDLEAQLESSLAEPFGADYGERLAAARANVRDSQD